MYTVSLTLDITVHNRYWDIELTSSVYFCNCGTYYEHPIKITYVGAIMKISFGFNPNQDESGGILMYKVQRKENTASDQPFNIDTITEMNEETSEMTQLLITWKIKHPGKPRANIMLVEYNEPILNEDKLVQLYNGMNDIFSGYSPSGCTWLMRDGTTLVTTYEVKGTGLEIIISRGSESVYTMKPMWINPKRQVSFFSSNILYTHLHC
jgi:hypothetical protein